MNASNFLVRVDHHDTVHNEWVHINDDGTVIVTLPSDAQEIAVKATYDMSMETYINCDAAKETDKERDIWYPISEILQSGVVAPNECSQTITPPSPASSSSSSGNAPGASDAELVLRKPFAPQADRVGKIGPVAIRCHPSPTVLDFVAQVAQAYANLIAGSELPIRESGLGGSLLYAGEIDDAGRALVVAANIAGAATLVATADRAAQKQAIRDGVVDFLVTSLDEALRILKNQLRKRETVSVCVAHGRQPAMESEMNERGVEPDLLRRDVRHGAEALIAEGRAA